MTISVIPIEHCFGDITTGMELIPKFDCLETEEPNFRLFRMQCQGDLVANDSTGVRNIISSHIAKCREALRIARSERVDLFLTPEYSIPVSLINEILTNTDLQPHRNKLWCLCCEGIQWEEFQDYMTAWADIAHIGKKTIEDINVKNFVGVLLYVFQSKEEDKLCIVPQLKLQPMRDPMLVCEGDGLTRGKKVILIGERASNQLASIICADAYHQDIKDSHIFFPECNEKKYIILHPQLNPSPRNGEISCLRNNIFSEDYGNSTIYVTSNWASGTTISLEHNTAEKQRINTPWSSIYRRYHSLSGNHWRDELSDVRKHNLNYGLGFAFESNKKYKVWFAHRNEHIQLISLRKPFGGGPEITRTTGTIHAKKVYVPDNENDSWTLSQLRFDTNLPSNLSSEAIDDFEYPSFANVEKREKFFGYCLGHLEEGELTLSRHHPEQSSRISYHIDNECEVQRIVQAERVVNLIRSLKRLKSLECLPSQIKRMNGEFKFHLVTGAPYNLIPKSGNEKNGVWVVYVQRDSELKQVAEQILNRHPEFRFIIEDRICIFSNKDTTGEIVFYPVHQNEYTSPNRVVSGTDFTSGGVTIEQPFD